MHIGSQGSETGGRRARRKLQEKINGNIILEKKLQSRWGKEVKSFNGRVEAQGMCGQREKKQIRGRNSRSENRSLVQFRFSCKMNARAIGRGRNFH